MEGVWKIGCLTKSRAREFFLQRVDNGIHPIDEEFLLLEEIVKYVIKVIKKNHSFIYNKNIEERSKISTSRAINSNP